MKDPHICFLLLANLSGRPCVCVSPCVHTLKHEYLKYKFYLKHHWGRGKGCISFGPDLIRTLVSMPAISSHSVIMGKTVLTLFLGCYQSDPFHTYR